MPLGRASAICGAALWGFTTADALAALEDGVANTHGDHAIALRGVILGHPVTHVRSPNAFAGIVELTRLGKAAKKHLRLMPRWQRSVAAPWLIL